MQKGRIESFRDLNAWKEGHKLVIMVYKSTETFPKSEQFGLAGQMRRAAVSVTSNVAEGFSRISNKEKLQFYSVAKGSLTELQSQLEIARDIDYILLENYNSLYAQMTIVHKLLNGLTTCIKTRFENSGPKIRNT